jgi:hypothetical protein
MTKIKIAMLAVVLFSAAVCGRGLHHRAIDKEEYSKEALLIHHRLQQDGLPTTVSVIERALVEIDSELPRYFPNGPFERDDLIALAWLESGFHQHEGGTHGERGLYQIMPDEFASYGVTEDFYDIGVQTEMALRVLRDKHERWHDYKLTVQAYNGLVRTKDGRLSERYWRAFVRRKIAVDELLERGER